jgi:oxygen-dependent protoporphyrinogen oxidase
VPYANLAVVTVRFAPGVVVPPGMTGVLAPPGAAVALTAITFVGQKWAHRADPVDVPVRVFYGRADGGPRAVDVLAWSEAHFRQQVAADLRQVLGWTADPLAVRVHRHPAAMPQYLVGHRQRVAEVEREVARRPGLALAGAALHGVGIPDVIRDGQAAAERVVRSLDPGPG